MSASSGRAEGQITVTSRIMVQLDQQRIGMDKFTFTLLLLQTDKSWLYKFFGRALYAGQTHLPKSQLQTPACAQQWPEKPVTLC